MPRRRATASYHVAARWRDFACLVCGDSTHGCPVSCDVLINWGDQEQAYSFPCCSPICGHTWGAMCLEAVDGNKTALHLLVEAAAGKELDE